MKRKSKKTKPVEISCRAPNAKAVLVAGTFNDWKADELALEKEEEGDWRITLALSPGAYEYKFLVDGEWCCEAGCEHEYRGCVKCVPNEHGTMNRVLEVP